MPSGTAAVAGRDQVAVLLVLLDVVGDERAEGHDLEPLSARVVQRADDEAAAEAAPFERLVHLGVDEARRPSRRR
jgi:hypothetical protein